MWCRHCQQQVPAIGSSSVDGARCARCGRVHLDDAPAETAVAGTVVPDATASRADSRRVIDRALRTARATVAAGPAATTLRFDLAESGLKENQPPSAPPPRRSALRDAPPTAPTAFDQWSAWLVASLGALALGIGLALIGLSTLGDRYELWRSGLAATFAGQGLLIVGLLQILANVWRAGRHASWRLGQMHDELRRLRRSNEQAAGRHAASASQFYAELAHDATPDVLMGNLQGQIDRLAARLRAE